ncbi:MAG: ABC transporter permease, partial [Oscillospiraceae bacterium]|nr:ABC transporter permease [Oscillospiraceae bacterium]
VFLIYCAVMILFYFTQFHNDCSEPKTKPAQNRPGINEFGYVIKEDPEIVMPNAIKGLINEYLSGSFKAYPVGFYKNVRLKEKQKNQVAEIIFELSGITPEELNSFEDYAEGGYLVDENGQVTYQEANTLEFDIPENLSYERFRELMREVDKIIGGGSDYCDAFILGNFSLVPKTLEDALAEYEEFMQEDNLIKGYARLYCDYMGIFLSILPIFVVVSFLNQDKKSRMQDLIYSRPISSVKLIFTRYFALVICLLLPIILTAILANAQVKSIYPDKNLNHFVMYQYMLGWLLPNIMIVSAIGMLITNYSGLLAIFAQGAWWFHSALGISDLSGSIGKFTLVMRHNSLMEQDIFYAQWHNIVFNRIFFTVLAIVIIVFTVFIYELKRKGVINGFQPNFKK